MGAAAISCGFPDFTQFPIIVQMAMSTEWIEDVTRRLDRIKGFCQNAVIKDLEETLGKIKTQSIRQESDGSLNDLSVSSIEGEYKADGLKEKTGKIGKMITAKLNGFILANEINYNKTMEKEKALLEMRKELECYKTGIEVSSSNHAAEIINLTYSQVEDIRTQLDKSRLVLSSVIQENIELKSTLQVLEENTLNDSELYSSSTSCANWSKCSIF